VEKMKTLNSKFLELDKDDVIAAVRRLWGCGRREEECKTCRYAVLREGGQVYCRAKGRVAPKNPCKFWRPMLWRGGKR
jgi:hypothetical protein